MKKISSLKIVLAVLGLSSVASLVGSISGTIAWYAYSSRALVSYTGTSVTSSTQLQIGIKSDVVVEDLRPKGNTEPKSGLESLVEDVTFEGDNNHYYFMRAGAGGMPAAVINAYLSQKGYTTNILEPTSSYAYATGGTFNLRNRHATGDPDMEHLTEAEITKYVEIPFVFRVVANKSSSNPQYMGDCEIFITGAKAEAVPLQSGKPNNINKSLRLYIDRSNGDNFIFNPNEADDGKTKVAGVLNLAGVDGNGDGYFDYDNKVGSPTYGQELLYGDYEFADGYTSLSECVTESTDLNPTPTDLVDINYSGISDKQTTFTSKHYPGISYFTYTDTTEEGKTIRNIKGIKPHYAEYLGTNTVFATKNAAGTYGYWDDNPNDDVEPMNCSVCKTANTGNKIGSFNMKVYLEGWDFSVIDEELNHQFYLGLTFQINAIQ